jgi:hypothetical protein
MAAAKEARDELRRSARERGVDAARRDATRSETKRRDATRSRTDLN